jgi:hypothetical protein
MTALAIPLAPEVTSLGTCQDDLFLINFEPFAVVLDARAMRFSSVNGIGKEVLPELLETGLDATVARLAGRYQIDPARVRDDLSAFLANLEQHGVLPRGGRPRSLLGGLLRCVYRSLARLSLWWKARGLPGRLPERPLSRCQEKELRSLIAAWLRGAWVSLRLLGWSQSLRLWRCPAVQPDPMLPRAAIDQVTALVDRLVREEAAGKWLFDCACKERALVASYCLQRCFGLQADVVLGMMPVPFRVHAWSVCAGRKLTDDPERIATFRPVLRFPLS